MSDENNSQNSNPEENPLPTSLQEPTPPSHEASGGQGEPASENTQDSEPSILAPLTHYFKLLGYKQLWLC